VLFKGVRKTAETGFDTAVQNIVSYADADTAKKAGIRLVTVREIISVLLLKIFFDRNAARSIELSGTDNQGTAAFDIQASQTLDSMKDSTVVAGPLRHNHVDCGTELVLVEFAVWCTEAENPAGISGCVLGNFHWVTIKLKMIK
jgi:hypothetical protein